MNIELSVKERLRKVYKYLSISQTELARQIDVHPSQISILGTERRPDISKDLAKKISKRYMDINPWWLLTGEGEMLMSLKNENKLAEVVEEESPKYGDPLDGLRELLDKHEQQIKELRREVERLKKRL